MNIRHALVWVGIALAGAACGKKGGGGAPAVSVTPADADAVNALVPAELKAKVTFEVTTIVDDFHKRNKHDITVVAPKGWKKGFMPGELKPDGLGFKTSFRVDSNCDGTCEPKDWAATSDKVVYSQFTGGKVTGKVIKDDKQKTGRTMVFEETTSSGDKEVHVMTTWWTEGGRNYWECSADLDGEAAPLGAAVEKACSKVSISGDD